MCVCFCESKCMKIKSEKKTNRKPPKRNFCNTVRIHTSLFIQIRKSHGFEVRKSTSAESIHSHTESTPEKRKRKRIYQFHLADSVHTTHTLLCDTKGKSLFNTRSVLFFRLKCRSVSPSQSDMPQ